MIDTETLNRKLLLFKSSYSRSLVLLIESMLNIDATQRPNLQSI